MLFFVRRSRFDVAGDELMNKTSINRVRHLYGLNAVKILKPRFNRIVKICWKPIGKCSTEIFTILCQCFLTFDIRVNYIYWGFISGDSRDNAQCTIFQATQSSSYSN